MHILRSRRGRVITAAFSSAAAALVLATLPALATDAPSPAVDALTAAGAPERPDPGTGPDPALPSHALAPGDAALDNPLKGFARFYVPGSDQNAGYPHSLTWSYFGLSEVMSDPSDCGTYDWDVLDSALEEIGSAGNQAALRFYMEYPDADAPRPSNAIPPCFDGHVDTRENAEWGTVSPDYDSPYLLDGLKDFIAAFGERYDGDPRIGYIHLGLIGLWGEWHTYPKPELMPTDAHGAEIIQAYDNAFSTTRLELRYPDAAGGAADDLPAIGYHDDSFCYREGSPLAGVTLPASMGGADWSQLQIALEHGVENRWTTASMGGEVRPEIQGRAFDNWPGGSGDVDDMKACIELEHSTWKMNERSKAYSPGDPEVAEAVRLMGYDFTVSNSYFEPTAQGSATVGVQMVNNGVAPFYYPWDIQLGLKNSAGDVVKTWDTSWDLREVMPAKIRAFPDWGVGSEPTYLDFGHPRYFDTTVDLTAVSAGDYEVVMKVRNPLEDINSDAKKLRFSNAGQHADGWLDLGGMTVEAGQGSGRT